MEEGFSARLKATLLSAGIDSTEDLVRRCQKAGKVRLTAERVAEVLADPEHAVFCDVTDLAMILSVRPVWLVRGLGVASPTVGRMDSENELLTLASLLPEEQAERLLKFGRMLKLHS